MIDFTLSQLMMRIGAVLLISALHGWALAMAAGALGDAGPKHDGRLSIDPLRHVDLLGGAVALIFSIGWARWVAIDPRALRHGRFDLLLVVLAGFVAIVFLEWAVRANPDMLVLPGGPLPGIGPAATDSSVATHLTTAAIFAGGVVRWLVERKGQALAPSGSSREVGSKE